MDAETVERRRLDSLALLTAYQRAAQDFSVNGKFVYMCRDANTHEGASDKTHVYHCKIDAVVFVMAVEAHARGTHQNVYFDPAVRRTDLKKGDRGGLADIVAPLSLMLEEDADVDKLVTLPAGIEPSFTVETSGRPTRNHHFHFIFDRLVPREEAQELAELAFRKCGGDVGGKDISHSWRVPGTCNFPNWKKLQRGRPSSPQEVRIVGGDAPA